MNKFVIFSIAVIMLAAFAQSAFAAATDIQFYGYTWFRYTALNQNFSDTTFTTDKMSVERTYLRWKLKYEQNIEGNLTLDLPMKSGNTSNSDWNTLVKYAYIDVKQYVPLDGFVRVGVQPVYFCMIDRWEYPLIQKPVEDVNGLMSSADLGASVQGFLPEGWGDYQLAVYNGNGYAKPTETDRNMATAANATIVLMPGLSVRGSAYSSHISTSDAFDRSYIFADKSYTGLAVNYYVGPFWFMAESITGKKPNSGVNASTDISATSLFVQYTLNEVIDIAARQDVYDPNTAITGTDNSNSATTRSILGMNYKWFEDLLLQVNFEHLAYEGAIQTSGASKPRSADDYIMTQLKWSF